MLFLFSILGWALAGVVVGVIATRLVELRGDDPRISIGLAALAAVVGAWAYNWISGTPVALFNLWTLLFAVLAASAAVAAWHVARSRGTYKQPSYRRSY